MIFNPSRRLFALATLAALLILVPVAAAQATTAQVPSGWSLQQAFWSFAGPWLVRWVPESWMRTSETNFDPTGPPNGSWSKVGSDADPAGGESAEPMIEVGATIDPAGHEGTNPDPDPNG